MYDLFISGIPENQPVGEPNIYVIVNKQNLNEGRAHAMMIKWGKKPHQKIHFYSNLNLFSYKFSLTFYVFTFLRNIKMLSIFLNDSVRIRFYKFKVRKR